LLTIPVFQQCTGFERRPQPRADQERLSQSEIVGVDGRWGENSFSATIAQQARRFAQANDNRPQTSLPRRNKLTEFPIHEKEKAVENSTALLCSG